ncbi:cyclodeaminase/cyclohydrolase family protein [Vagococcus sp. DIV0080]|uniref:Cyclodeaminase/cyclohydrolase family protein n=1 Tax=Candidatus Vagococcus giribetii TaxID=2230876 RepID=A0ABS3HQP1_9ENTE|nr:cyclodeaminase/cyclohydrolase family protein [Vagococcus sp. DIV0080]MBO0475655.1 cyclodeaminase/cyclohydrolase family protein [Vagococcus sp. DIV0080]
MKLVEMDINTFIATLGSDAPAPGGGSASALAGAVGSALTMMVAELTIGKKKYLEYDSANKELLNEIKKINQQLLACIDRDTEAFNGVSAVFKLPKETDEDLLKRKEAMQMALKNATLVPLDIMKLAYQGLVATEKGIGKSNINAASDLGVSALNLDTCLKGAWLNVLINLSGVKDESFVNDIKEEGQKLLTDGTHLAEKIYTAILEIV